jgi:hydrogenase/urease accessory protein HupE
VAVLRYHVRPVTPGCIRIARAAGLLAAVCLCLLRAAPADAHPVPFSYLDLHLQPETVPAPSLDVTLVVHVFDAGHDLNVSPPERLLDPDTLRRYAPALEALLTPRFAVSVDGRAVTPHWQSVEPMADRQSIRLRATFDLEPRPAHEPGQLRVWTDLFPYDPQHQTFLNVYEDAALSQAILDHAHGDYTYYTHTRQGVLDVIARMLPEGIHHILIGPDHILFLIGLLLTGGTIRQLALIVTSFTLAHSLTLSLAALNLVTPSPRLIEPAIALSIVYVGADNLLVREGGRDMRMWIAFGFGFIHGFGFANVLREMELPKQALVWSLFSFNLGVEIGQLLIVGVVATALAWVRERSASVARQVVVAGSIVVIVAGACWFIQRVFFPGGSS